MIEAMCASQSRTRVINTHMALATTQKRRSTITEYFAMVKALADDMVSTGKKLDDEDLASYMLSGLNIELSPVMSTVDARTKPISLGKLYTQLVGFEQRMSLLQGGSSGSSANMASHGGRGGGNSCGGCDCGHGRNCGRGSDGCDHLVCQLCGKEGHTVVRCYKRFNSTFQGSQEQKFYRTWLVHSDAFF